MSQSSYTSMVSWMGQPQGWPDGDPGSVNPIQFTTNIEIDTSGGDNIKITIGGHHDHSYQPCCT